jgi:putative ABC transport system permease protein
MENLLQDIRYGFRILRKSPGFTAVAVITLALGIGANTAIFSLVNAVLFRPLPYPDPNRLLFVAESQPQVPELGFSVPDADDIEREAHSFEHIGWYCNTASVYGREDGSERIDITYATHGLLPALGVRPFIGSGFGVADDEPGAGHTALLSYAFWQTQMGADPNAIGRTLTVDGRIFTIAGVLPRDFSFYHNGAVWLPLGAWPYQRVRDDHWAMYSVARLKSGVSLKAAQGELDAIGSQLQRQYPQSNALISLRAVPLKDRLVGNTRPALLLLLSAVGFVLLIACANVANLLLARASLRQREIAIRAALGAPPARVIRQLLTESVLLSLIGGAAGLALADGTFGLILRLGGDRLPRSGPVIDHAVLWFTLALSVLAGIVFGTVPAFRVAHGHGGVELREGRSFTAGVGRGRLRSALMLSEVAISVVLLIAAGLLIKSFAKLRGVDPGFNPRQLLSLRISLPHGAYRTDDDKLRFEQRTLDQISILPGVQSAAFARALPTQGDDWGTWYWAEGEPQPAPGRWPLTYAAIVSPRYFSTLEIPMVAGRVFTEADNQSADPVAIVSETFAQRHWPHQSALGKHLNFPVVTPGTRTVIGVVSDIKNDGLAASPHEQVFVPYTQPMHFGTTAIVPNLVLLCRTQVPPLMLGEGVKRKLQGVDPAIAVSAITTMDDVLGETVSDRHFSMVLLGLFATLALMLAAIGIYGVISFSVSQRTHEIGVRIALGARLGQVQWMVVRAALKTVLIGLAVGGGISLLPSRLISSQLFGVRSTDPEVMGIAAIILTVVGVAAAFFPARRAAKVDPMVALRYE